MAKATKRKATRRKSAGRKAAKGAVKRRAARKGAGRMKKAKKAAKPRKPAAKKRAAPKKAAPKKAAAPRPAPMPEPMPAAEPAAPGAAESVCQLRDAEYDITARVIRRYDDGVSSPFPVFEAGWFRFYSPSAAVAGLAEGNSVRLRGTLALDHYMWVEFLGRYRDPPDLFYNVRVRRVRRVAIPTGFVQRGERSISHPAALAPGDYDADAVEEVQAVEQTEAGPAFSLLDLELLPAGEGPQRPAFFGQ